jgi:hypothetical protein
MKKITLLYGGLIILITSCAKEDPIPKDPAVALLLSPVNNETCLDGVSLNDSQSDVSFNWSPVVDAVSYEVEVSNLLTQSSQTYTADSNQVTIALSKAEPYSWLVKSIGEPNSNPSESDSWKFYLAGDAIINYAPFPSELVSPRSGANITPNISNQVTLNWTCSDVEDDLVAFEVYLDENDGTTLNTTLDYQAPDTSIQIEVENTTTYYWKVVAIDANGNQSSSGVYAFRTN